MLMNPTHAVPLVFVMLCRLKPSSGSLDRSEWRRPVTPEIACRGVRVEARMLRVQHLYPWIHAHW